MVAFTGVVGFVLAGPSWDAASLLRLVALCFGTYFIVGSANAFNQILERHEDARMRRTACRPLPSRRLSVRAAVAFAAFAGIAGGAILFATHWASGVAGIVALAIYVAVYTPLKARSPWSTAAGAVSGAIPPVMGAFASGSGLNAAVCFAFALLFLWQFPHTWAIAVLHREDYDRVGYRLLPLVSGGVAKTRARTILYSVLLVVTSFVPVYLEIAGIVYLVVAMLLGVLMLRTANRFAHDQSAAPARRLLLATLVYLPVLLTLAAFEGSLGG